MDRRPPFEPFLLPAVRGERYCLFHSPDGTPRGAILYVHPFAEEINKSRRMAALQSRLFAAAGYAVLQIDLYGCGDSDGELRDATWDHWRDDLTCAERWMRQRVDAPFHLWGLRLGALLALDHASRSGERYAGVLLWQPVLNGDAHLTEFLRLRVAMGATGAAERTTTQTLRAELDGGTTLEIGGYDLSPALGAGIAAMKLEALGVRGMAVHWFELVAEEGRPLSPASRRVVDAWAAHGVSTSVHTLVGAPFWNTVEVVDAPALLEATVQTLAERRACA